MRDPDERLHLALSELYAYYEGAEAMLSNILRDLELVDAVRQQFATFLGYMDAAHAMLMRGRGRATRKRQATVGHAMSFGRPEPRAD